MPCRGGQSRMQFPPKNIPIYDCFASRRPQKEPEDMATHNRFCSCCWINVGLMTESPRLVHDEGHCYQNLSLRKHCTPPRRHTFYSCIYILDSLSLSTYNSRRSIKSSDELILPSIPLKGLLTDMLTVNSLVTLLF